MYERTCEATCEASSNVSSRKLSKNPSFSHVGEQAGALIRDMMGEDGARALDALLHSENTQEETICEIAASNLGLQYTPISELNTIGSAFCALFWDPRSNFIIVAFKGTTPTDFMEWRTNFTFNMSEANQWLRGFGRGELDHISVKLYAEYSNPKCTTVSCARSSRGKSPLEAGFHTVFVPFIHHDDRLFIQAFNDRHYRRRHQVDCHKNGSTPKKR